MKITKILTILIAAISFSISANADEKSGNKSPSDFNKLSIYMATGLFDPNVSSPLPGVTGCTGVFCDGEFFQYNISHRTPAQVAAIESGAKQYFLDQFGINVDDPALANRVMFKMFMVNPDFEYRLYELSGENVSKDGWIIRDGGYMLAVLDPNGIELGGVQAGTTVPKGAMAFYGNYNILKTNKSGKPTGELIVYYQSIYPGITLPDGSFSFKCAVFNSKLGEGLGLGTINTIPQSNGLIRGNARNVITFPPSSSVVNFPSHPAFDAQPK